MIVVGEYWQPCEVHEIHMDVTAISADEVANYIVKNVLDKN